MILFLAVLFIFWTLGGLFCLLAAMCAETWNKRWILFFLSGPSWWLTVLFMSITIFLPIYVLGKLFPNETKTAFARL